MGRQVILPGSSSGSDTQVTNKRRDLLKDISPTSGRYTVTVDDLEWVIGESMRRDQHRQSDLFWGFSSVAVTALAVMGAVGAVGLTLCSMSAVRGTHVRVDSGTSYRTASRA
jgi:hypothetical protein